jgi:hypothetical protein
MTKELEDVQAELAETIRELKDLIASRAWGRYSGLMEEQIQGRIDSIILSPVAGADATYHQEYAKGEIAGIKLALLIIPNLIDNMEDDFAKGEAALGANDE